MPQQRMRPVEKTTGIRGGVESHRAAEPDLAEPPRIRRPSGAVDRPGHGRHGMDRKDIEVLRIQLVEVLVEVQHQGVVAQVGSLDCKRARVIGDGPPHAAAAAVAAHDQIKLSQLAGPVTPRRDAELWLPGIDEGRLRPEVEGHGICMPLSQMGLETAADVTATPRPAPTVIGLLREASPEPMKPGVGSDLEPLEVNEPGIKAVGDADEARRSQTMARDVDRVAAIGVVGLGAEVVVGTLKNSDLEPALLGQRRSQRQARRPATDDRHAECHVVSSRIPPGPDPILEMHPPPSRAMRLKRPCGFPTTPCRDACPNRAAAVRPSSLRHHRSTR